MKTVQMNKNDFSIIKGIELVIRIIIGYIFASHGINALLLNETMLQYFTFLGLSTNLSVSFLIIVGIIDLVVAGLILFKPKKFIVIWTIIWPIAPAVMEQLVNPDKLSHFLSHLIQNILPGVILYLILFTPLVERIVKTFRRRI